MESSVRLQLRPSEELKATLEAVSFLAEGHDDSERLSSQNKRILAVVSHKSEISDHEEGSVFLLRPRNNGAPDELEVYRMFPVFDGFTISITQTRRGTLDLGSSSSGSVLDQPSSGFVLTINPGNNSEPSTLLTSDIQSLRSVLEECKKLKEISNIVSGATYIPPLQTYSWLAPYTSRTDVSSMVVPIPLDLRIVNAPLHTRLSDASAGLPGDDDYDIVTIKDDWVRLKARTICRKSGSDLSLRLGTFNVNGRLPSQDLSGWVQGSPPSISTGEIDLLVEGKANNKIPPLKNISPLSMGEIVRNPFDIGKESPMTTSSSTSTLVPSDISSGPDMLVLAFQEVDLSAEALLYATRTAKEDAWCTAVFASLGEKAVLYEKLASRQLVGILLVVIVRKELRDCFSELKNCATGVGIMGVMGNKGGVAIRLQYTPLPSDGVSSPHPATLTFVNSHLAAFDEMVDKRNGDFQELSRKLVFDSGLVFDGKGATSPTPALISLYESDVLFWMGDLNYRIDIEDEDVRGILASESWDNKVESLQKYDQLKNSMRARKAFEGFYEHPITHLPTYRYSAGVLTDEMGYDLKRKPAWTDRILHLRSSTTNVKQLSYASHPEIAMSDHRPVSGDFNVEVDLIDKKEYEATVRRLYRQVIDLTESRKRPSIQLQDAAVDLGSISYKREKSKIITIKNNGKIPCAYRFVPTASGASTHPEWLSIEPMTGLLLPDEVAQITLSACVSKDSASRLNLGPNQIDCTLILHTVLGKDYFISVSAQYEYTCFANKLSRLTRLPGPIRNLTSPDNLLPEDRAINAPREIVRLVNWLMTNTTNSQMHDLFLSAGDDGIVRTICECLDTGAEFPYSSGSQPREVVLAFGGTLLLLLDSLIEPVVPVSLHTRCTQVTTRDEAFELLDAFPHVSVNVWISVTAFLHYINQQDSDKPDKTERIANIFAPILLYDDPTSLYPLASPLGKRNFLMYFIS